MLIARSVDGLILQSWPQGYLRIWNLSQLRAYRLHQITPPQQAIETSSKWCLICSKVTDLAAYIFVGMNLSEVGCCKDFFCVWRTLSPQAPTVNGTISQLACSCRNSDCFKAGSKIKTISCSSLFQSTWPAVNENPIIGGMGGNLWAVGRHFISLIYLLQLTIDRKAPSRHHEASNTHSYSQDCTPTVSQETSRLYQPKCSATFVSFFINEQYS